MQLKELAAKPKLELVVVDTPVIVQAYGEALEFYMWDRQDLPTYLKLAQIKENPDEIFEIVKDVVLDQQGKPVLGTEDRLPVDIMIPVLEAAIQQLGNKTPQTSAP